MCVLWVEVVDEETATQRSPWHGAGQVARAGGLRRPHTSSRVCPQRRLWPSNTSHRRHTLPLRESPAGKLYTALPEHPQRKFDIGITDWWLVKQLDLEALLMGWLGFIGFLFIFLLTSKKEKILKSSYFFWCVPCYFCHFWTDFDVYLSGV